ncbi:MAG: hypothetical protein KGI25_05330 [Thaumarchaeota archaeon]|nr:hypothetical protein [Nitrososphaerota archaeon]
MPENCGAPMEDWSATHCSEECLLDDIRHSESYFDDSNIDELITKMKKANHFDIRLLNKLR